MILILYNVKISSSSMQIPPFQLELDLTSCLPQQMANVPSHCCSGFVLRCINMGLFCSYQWPQWFFHWSFKLSLEAPLQFPVEGKFSSLSQTNPHPAGHVRSKCHGQSRLDWWLQGLFQPTLLWFTIVFFLKNSISVSARLLLIPFVLLDFFGELCENCIVSLLYLSLTPDSPSRQS